MKPELKAWAAEYWLALRIEDKPSEDEMGRYASDKGGGTEFRQAPAGTHVARCYSIIDLGTQHGEYLGEPTAREQIIIRWELPFETEEFEGVQKPLIVSRFYTNSLNEKATLRKDLENWRSRSFTDDELKRFDLNSILGAPCVVSVVLNDKGKAKVTGVGALPKGTACPPLFNPKQTFWLDEWNDGTFQLLPKGFQDLIAKSDEYKAAFTPPAVKKAVDEFSSPKRTEPRDSGLSEQEIDDIPF